MNLLKAIKLLLILAFLLIPMQLFAMETGGSHEPLDLTSSPIGYIALMLFIIAYLFVMTEEYTH